MTTDTVPEFYITPDGFLPASAEPEPEETQLDRIERKLDSLITDVELLKTMAPKVAEQMMQQMSASPVGRLLIKALGV